MANRRASAQLDLAPAAVLAALADPTRRAVLETVREGPLPVGEIAARLPISRPAVSQHLRVLAGARLVRCERRGTRRLYSAEPRGLLELQRYLQSFWGDALRAYQAAARHVARKETKK
jgi:DNA-binding transcriptional ArsR family regulator